MSTIHNAAELQGAELDLAVALAEGHQDAALRGEDDEFRPVCMLGHPSSGAFFNPSTDWKLGGPIIEREHIQLEPRLDDSWSAEIAHSRLDVDQWLPAFVAPTPLVAAMRAFVAFKFGETLEMP